MAFLKKKTEERVEITKRVKQVYIRKDKLSQYQADGWQVAGNKLSSVFESTTQRREADKIGDVVLVEKVETV